MPEVKMPVPEEGSDINSLVDIMFRYKKQLEYLLNNLDSMNVRSIITEFTKIHSEWGETIIDGPVLQMKDDNRDRLIMGLDKTTDDFIFELFDTSGIKTVSINSQGKAVFNGIIDVLEDSGGYTSIDGSKISMYDDSATLRLALGQDPSSNDFLFSMFDTSGNPTLYLNSSGEAVFSGNIETSKSAYIGDDLYIGQLSDDDTKSLFFHGGNANRDSTIISEIDGFNYSNMTLESWDIILSPNGQLKLVGGMNGIEIDAVLVSYTTGTLVDFSDATVTGLEESGYATKEYVDEAIAEYH